MKKQKQTLFFAKYALCLIKSYVYNIDIDVICIIFHYILNCISVLLRAIN